MSQVVSPSLRPFLPSSLLPAALAALLPAQTGAAPQADLPTGAPAGMAFIDRADLQKHATYLASDELGGRYTGTPGQVKAAEYIAKHFEDLGLLPLGDKGRGKKRSFFQKFRVERTYLDPKATSVVFGGKTYRTGFAVTSVKPRKRVRVSGSLVFCNTGNPKFLPKSLKRKIPVVVLSSSAGGPRGGMRGAMAANRTIQVARAVHRLGAAVVLFLVVKENSNVMDAMNTTELLPGKPMLRFGNKGHRSRFTGPIPMVFLPPVKSRELFGELGWEIDANSGELNQVKKRVSASGKVNLLVKVDRKFVVQNVCAMVKGIGQAQDAVIYSAHMDHLGTRMDDDAFNGADDNASGTSGLLDIAQAFAEGPKPKRSVIFLSVAGEELGLWGSEFYSDNPTWALKRLIANVNIDMIGRNSEQPVAVTPSPAHRAFSTLVQKAAEFAATMGIQLTSGDQYYRRSDHYNFAKKGVPVVFFCDGEHEDYHKVTDHADKLDFGKMERIARLAYWTGFHTANAPRRPRTLGKRSSWTR